MAGAALGLPLARAVIRSKTEVAILHQPGRAAGRRVVIIVLIDITKGVHRFLVAVAHIVADHPQTRAIRIDPHDHGTHIDMAVITFQARLATLVRTLISHGRSTSLVNTTDAQRPAVFIGDNVATGITGVEVPLATRAGGDGVQAVVMVLTTKTGQQRFFFIHLGIKHRVPVDIRVNEQIRRLGNHHLIINHRHSQRGDQLRVLDKDMALVCLTVSIAVCEHHDAVSLRHLLEALALVAVHSVIPALSHPHSALGIDIHVSRVVEQRRSRPKGDLKSLGNDKVVRRNVGHWLCMPVT